jgi:hypothetical protein
MNLNTPIRIDHFFAKGGTVEQLEELAQDEYSSSVSFDDLSLDWALDRADHEVHPEFLPFIGRDRGCFCPPGAVVCSVL